jgi:hypothetical protein
MARWPLRWIPLGLAAAALFGVVADPVPAWAPPSRTGGGTTIPVTPSRSPPLPVLGEALGPRLGQPEASDPPLPLVGHISIPAIGVDTSLVPIGLAPDGSLQAPADYDNAGWYSSGPFPGDPGAAVVAGHVDSTRGLAVFYSLRRLRPGDVIVVWRGTGSRSRFVVASVEWFAKSSFPTERVYGPVTGSALRLVTCGGAFDPSTHQYEDNLVVFALPAV